MLKRMTVVSFVLCVALSAVAKPRAADNEVRIESQTYGNPTALLTDLRRAIGQYPARNRFHLHWGLAEPHGSEDGDLIYNKKQGILRIEHSSTGYDDDTVPQSPVYLVQTHQWRFFGVTPRRLHQLFARYGDPTANDKRGDEAAYEVSFFPHLTEFGARGGLVAQKTERKPAH